MNTNYHNNLSDKELLDFYHKTNDSNWLGILLQRYTLVLFGVSMKYLKNENNAKDAVQQIFLKAINEIPKYEITYFKSWVYMVAKNHCLMQLRNKNITHEITDHTFFEDEAFDIESLQQKDKEEQLLTLALPFLNEDQKQCIEMFYFQKKSYQNIVDETSYTLMQVKSHIQNGKRNLKIIIENLRKENAKQ